MENMKKRWSVTYTKHIKQKRKVYQDGFLDHHIPTNKVKLFDESETLLECKILSKSEEGIFRSGETIPFNGYLVDIGDPEGDLDLKTGLKPNSINERHSTGCRPNSIRRSKFLSPKIASSDKNDDDVEQRRKPVNDASPSKKIIREFKKSELQKYVAFQGCTDTVKNDGVTEWQVVYTTQLTKKAKKYHDGFLRLVSSGSFGRQVGAFAIIICNSSSPIMLYDAQRELLDSRFLKKDEIIRSNESITFDAHLVDIGEPEGESQIPGDLSIKGIKQEHQDYPHDNKSLAIEWEALYTSQLTQNSKKYSSGILRLSSCGSYRKQVTLLTEDKTILSSKFLSSSEDVRTGSTLVLPKYLVEVGEPHNPKETSNSSGSYKVTIHDTGEGADSSSIYSVDRNKMAKISVTNKCLRDVNQILSILQKPKAQEIDVKFTNKTMIIPVSPAKGLQGSDTENCNPKDCQLTSVSLLNDGSSEPNDDSDSSETAGIEKYANSVTSKGDKLSRDCKIGISDQSHLNGAKSEVKPCDEAFASGFSSLVGDSTKKTTEQPGSAKKIDEWPTFDLGF